MNPNSEILANFMGTPGGGGRPIFPRGAPDNARGALRPSTPLWLEHWCTMQWSLFCVVFCMCERVFTCPQCFFPLSSLLLRLYMSTCASSRCLLCCLGYTCPYDGRLLLVFSRGGSRNSVCHAVVNWSSEWCPYVMYSIHLLF